MLNFIYFSYGAASLHFSSVFSSTALAALEREREAMMSVMKPIIDLSKSLWLKPYKEYLNLYNLEFN